MLNPRVCYLVLPAPVIERNGSAGVGWDLEWAQRIAAGGIGASQIDRSLNYTKNLLEVIPNRLHAGSTDFERHPKR